MYTVVTAPTGVVKGAGEKGPPACLSSYYAHTGKKAPDVTASKYVSTKPTDSETYRCRIV